MLWILHSLLTCGFEYHSRDTDYVLWNQWSSPFSADSGPVLKSSALLNEIHAGFNFAKGQIWSSGFDFVTFDLRYKSLLVWLKAARRKLFLFVLFCTSGAKTCSSGLTAKWLLLLSYFNNSLLSLILETFLSTIKLKENSSLFHMLA